MRDAVSRLVIADDHPMFRDGLIRALDHGGDYTVVGKAGNGAEALRLIREHTPDLAVLDISMPEMDGLEVARTVHNEALPTEVVILTMYKDLIYFNAAMDVGVRGYLLKDSAVSEFLNRLNAVRDGEHYISPSLSHLLIEREKKQQALLRDVPSLDRLTPAERSILRLVARNLTNKEIAEKCFVSVRTVENHRTHIGRKLGLHGPHKLLEFALENKEAL